MQTFSQNFAFFHENKRSANEAKFRENMKRENFCKNAKCENFVKTMSFIIAAKINCSKKLVEFSANTAQYLKNSHFLNFRILWFFPYRSFYITMFQYYHVWILPCFNITMFQYYHVSILPSFNITIFQYYHVSILPCFNITMLQYYHVSILPCFNITMFQYYHVSKINKFLRLVYL